MATGRKEKEPLGTGACAGGMPQFGIVACRITGLPLTSTHRGCNAVKAPGGTNGHRAGPH